MKRSKPLQADPAKHLAWQRRSQQNALANQRNKSPWVAKQVPQRRDDGPWRREVFAAYGAVCRVRGCSRSGALLHAHHIIHRSMCGPSVRQNGMAVCGRHHDQIHAYLIRIDRSWLATEQIRWLASKGHAWWLADGTVAGPHCRLFAPTEEGKPQ